MSGELERLRRYYGGHTPGLLGKRHEYAVLCPLVEQTDGLHLLFEVRSAAVRQAGETCFPGGRMEPGETPTDCALRETEEELAIPPAEIRLLGEGDFICSQRGFLLRPLPGLVSHAGFAALRPAPAEVATYTLCRWNFFAVRRRSAILTICCPMCRIISPMKPWASRGTTHGPPGGWKSPCGSGGGGSSGA